MDASAIPAVFLHNCGAVVITLLLTVFLRIRWLAALIAWGLTIGASFLWKDIGPEWYDAWMRYLYRPVVKGGLWHGTVTDVEIIGTIIFWLLPLGLAYATTLARITKIKD